MKKFEKPIYVTRPLLPDLDKLRDKLGEVWGSKWLTNNGMQHQLLEEKIAGILKVPGISLFNNGTIALITAIQSLRLTGEVITTPFTFPATPHVLNWNNIKPIFCDIEPNSLTIDANKIETMITPRTTGILGVHVFGNPCDVAKIQAIADKHGLKVIYDAAHAFGTEINGVGIGAFGDISMFSFHATKLFHTAEGGALAFRDKKIKPLIDYLKNFGIKNEEEVVMPGINGKLNEIQAILGLLVLEMVANERNKRGNISALYKKYLAGIPGITFMDLPKNVRSSYQYFVIRIDRENFGRSRDEVFEKLKEYNVFTRKYFYPLCSEYSFYRNLPSADPANLPVAHEIVQETLALPFYGELSEDDVSNICEIIK
ncbi:MAG: DegT/DnrJ/EryC1/StrS family aminotransferase [Candidatus Omnitrophica bacterium]|nr:DegT/DnrJ/EryC1/StrS family aminotransferase [Candidatus Omnitrophota bacterium]